MTDKPIAILPCPFCGEPPASAFVGDDDGGYWAIECAKCMKTGGGRFIGCHCDDETSAVAAWNTRTDAATIADPLKDSLDDRIRQLRVAAINYSNGDEKLAKRTVEWLAADEFSATIAELREAEKLTEQLHAKMTCMCGSDINHSAWEGHSPVSMYDYALEAAEARATAAERALATLVETAKAAYDTVSDIAAYEIRELGDLQQAVLDIPVSARLAADVLDAAEDFAEAWGKVSSLEKLRAKVNVVVAAVAAWQAGRM